MVAPVLPLGTSDPVVSHPSCRAPRAAGIVQKKANPDSCLRGGRRSSQCEPQTGPSAAPWGPAAGGTCPQKNSRILGIHRAVPHSLSLTPSPASAEMLVQHRATSAAARSLWGFLCGNQSIFWILLEGFYCRAWRGQPSLLSALRLTTLQ